MLGSTLLYLGELVSAVQHLEQGIALYNPRERRSLTFNAGTDPGVMCISRAGWTLWMLGYPEQALKRVHEALTLAQELSHPYSLAFALHYVAVLHQSRREVQLTQKWAEATIKLSSEQGFAYYLGAGMCMRGWALAEQGTAEEGIAQLHQGLTIWQGMGIGLAQTHMLFRLAEAYRKGGQVQEGLRVLAEALAAVHKNAERHCQAELYRLRGELILLQAIPDEQQAETSFHQALDFARYQYAKSLELRAVIGLTRQWQKQGKRAEASQMLAAVYAWFTEGFETPDLQEAKVLLEELA